MIRKKINIIERLFAKFIGYNFTDIVSNRCVYEYECKDGIRFLANSRLESIFFYVII